MYNGEEMEEEKLYYKHKAFADKYLLYMNGVKAYQEVYPKASYDSACVNASKLIRNAKVSAYIEQKLIENQMSAEEALALLADIARGDLGEFMDISSVGFNLDLLDEDGNKKNTRLIKKIKQKITTFISKKESDEDREVTETEIELYPADGAIRDVLKIHGKFIDRHDITTDGKAISIRLVDDAD